MKASATCSRSVSVFVLSLLLISLPFIMGAKWAEKPIESLKSIAGTWKGSGINARGFQFETKYVFRKDGSYDYWVSGRSYSDTGQKPPGTLYLNGGKLMYKNAKGMSRTGILEEDKKGRRAIKFQGQDGAKWTVREKQ